jgi:hypothetical protein
MAKMRNLTLAAALIALAVPFTFAQTPGTETATQGDFAVLFVDYAKLDPEASWTAESAIDALIELGIEPLDGWDAEEPLTEGTMVFLLRFVDVPVFTADPDRLVTMNEARAMFERFERILIENVPALKMLTAETATTHGVRALGNVVPASP